MAKVGEFIMYYDSRGNPRPALVTNIFGGADNPDASVNVVVVNDDDAQSDNYGRKIERFTSVPAKSGQPAHGNYWAEL